MMEKSFTITNNFLDKNDRLKPTAILDLMQEIASNNADTMGIGFDEFIKNDLIWVVTRNFVEIVEDVKNPKEVNVVTDIAKSRLIECPRDYVIYHDDKPIIKARSIWMIYDLKEQKAILPEKYQSLLTDNVGLYSRIKRLPLFDIKDLEFKEEVKVKFSFLDHNGHMNNTHYLDLYLDVFGVDENRPIKSFQAEYIGQCFLGDTISLYSKEEEDKNYLYGYVDGQLKFYLVVNF